MSDDAAAVLDIVLACRRLRRFVELIHEYDRINWHLVWKTAIGDVPHLLAELEAVVPTDEPPPDAEGTVVN